MITVSQGWTEVSSKFEYDYYAGTGRGRGMTCSLTFRYLPLQRMMIVCIHIVLFVKQMWEVELHRNCDGYRRVYLAVCEYVTVMYGNHWRIAVRPLFSLSFSKCRFHNGHSMLWNPDLDTKRCVICSTGIA